MAATKVTNSQVTNSVQKTSHVPHALGLGLGLGSFCEGNFVVKGCVIVELKV